MVPENHPLLRVANQIDFSFVREETLDLYSETYGRPAYPPEQLFKMLLLEIWMNLSERQVCQQLHYNLLYRAFCGIGWNDRVPDDTTLVKFRNRLGDERFERLFQRLTCHLQEQGLIDHEWVVVDGTKVVADVAIRNTLQLVREGRRRLVRELEKTDPDRAAKLKPLTEPLPEGNFPNRQHLLAGEMEQGRKVIEQLSGVNARELNRLKEVYEAILAGTGTASLDDPDARWGFKKSDEPYLGYKTHAAVDADGYVSAFTVTPAPSSEQKQVEQLLDQVEAVGIQGTKFVADKGYDGQSVRDIVREHSMRAFIPLRDPPKIPEGFKLKTPQQLKCPKGHTARATRQTNADGVTFVFSQKRCQKCSLRSQCLNGNEKRKRIYYNHKRMRAPLGMKKAMKVRAGIERVFGSIKKWHGYGRARYRGRGKLVIQTALTFMVWNMKKASRVWAT